LKGIANRPADVELASNPELTAVLDNCYRRHFGNIRSISRPQDKERQIAGIDVILNFNDHREPIFIDEKIRREDYGDILLEEYSNYEKKTKGWLEENLRTHFISYIWINEQKMLILPYQSLRLAYLSNKARWTGMFQRRFAQNNGYKTSNIPIATQELFDGIWRASWELW